MKKFVVAVDGPAGSGKSTVSKIIAKRYGFTYLDTGAMYRMIALKVLRDGLDLEDIEKIEEMLSKSKIDIDGEKFILDGKDVSSEIRSREVTAVVSKVAAVKIIREKLVDMQRSIGSGKKVILDGRDIGTVVFPDADLKVFLVASPDERAMRRVKDYEEKGHNAEFESVLKEIKKRDKIDSTRKESPLKKASDAVELDTSGMSIEDVCGAISEMIDIRI